MKELINLAGACLVVASFVGEESLRDELRACAREASLVDVCCSIRLHVSPAPSGSQPPMICRLPLLVMVHSLVTFPQCEYTHPLTNLTFHPTYHGSGLDKSGDSRFRLSLARWS